MNGSSAAVTEMMVKTAAATPALVSAGVEVRGVGHEGPASDLVAEEVPVAMVYNGISHAVMMATPSDLEDFALGFSLTEGIITHADDLFDIDLEWRPEGISIEMRLSGERFAALKQRRRNMTGRTGCGLCGTESLEQAIRPIPVVGPRPAVGDAVIQHAVRTLKAHQPIQAETGATHAAAWCDRDGRVLAVREDVGRHNALDKLVGFWLRKGLGFDEGFLLISSRASFEMVQKSAAAGIGCLVAVSAPTALAIREARKAAMRLVGFARPGRHVIYNPGDRPVQENNRE